MYSYFDELYDSGFYDDSVINAIVKDESNGLEFKDDIATESEMGFIIIASTQSKLASKYYSSAKKKFKYGDKETALKMMYDARSLFEKCLQKAYAVGSKNKKEYKEYEGSTGIVQLPNVGWKADARVRIPKDYTKLYIDNSINIAIRFYKIMINKCDIHILAFKNNMESPKFKELTKEIDIYDKELKEAYRLGKLKNSPTLQRYINEHNM